MNFNPVVLRDAFIRALHTLVFAFVAAEVSGLADAKSTALSDLLDAAVKNADNAAGLAVIALLANFGFRVARPTPDTKAIAVAADSSEDDPAVSDHPVADIGDEVARGIEKTKGGEA